MMSLFEWLTIKKWGKRIAIAFAVIYALGVIDRSFPGPPACPVEEHVFQGQKFDVEFCHRYLSSSQFIGIRVFSKEGEQLAVRKATFANESSLNYMAIEDTMIRYSDNTSDLRNASIPEDCVLNMPPTWVDWLETRLPGGIPGVNHCGKASDEVISKAQDQWERRLEAKEKKQKESLTPAAPGAASPAPR